MLVGLGLFSTAPNHLRLEDFFFFFLKKNIVIYYCNFRVWKVLVKVAHHGGGGRRFGWQGGVFPGCGKRGIAAGIPTFSLESPAIALGHDLAHRWGGAREEEGGRA